MERGVAWGRATAIIATLLGVLVLAPAALAAIGAEVSVQTTPGTRIVVKLTSSTALPAKRRPIGVFVKANRLTFRLNRVKGAGAAVVSLGTWETGRLKAVQRSKALALRGKRITLILRLRKGSLTLHPTVASVTPQPNPPQPNPPSPNPPSPSPPSPSPPSPSPPAPTPPPPLFTPPGQELTGMAAWDSIKQYFLNSEFSDCQAGRFPSCSLEHRYEHGSDGSWEYHRCQWSSGGDINSYDSVYVTGVVQHADGSWAIEYTLKKTPAAFYHWEVGTDGSVNGYYTLDGANREDMLGYVWRQPAHLGDCYS